MLSRSFAGFVDFVNCLSGGPIGANPDINQALANEKGESHELCYADRSAAYIKLGVTNAKSLAGRPTFVCQLLGLRRLARNGTGHNNISVPTGFP